MASTLLQGELNTLLGTFRQVTRGTDDLHVLMERLRQDMEIPTQPSFRSGITNTNSQPNQSYAAGGGGRQMSSGMSWRNGATSFQPKQSSNPSHSNHKSSSSTPPGRYISKFITTGSIDNKILNTVIGNKLNAFTPLTYNDSRDFIYQILDSGETEFIKDFIEKVFAKATVEDLYCGLFAKLIAEIAHKYPVMYDEMKRYHKEFIKIFDEAGDGDHMKRMYRMGYGQFLSELASLEALDKEDLIEIVKIVNGKIWELTSIPDKTKVVEEFVDCLVRLSNSLKERSPKFFQSVKGYMSEIMLENIKALIGRTAGDRPSLSSKGRFGLMDLKDLL
jgi:hypothetical protein